VGVLRLKPISKTDEKRNPGKSAGGNKGRSDETGTNDLIVDDGRRPRQNENESLKVPAVESEYATESSGGFNHTH